jgi:riboflavin kinase/FMN adenylyltransferase
VKVYHGIDNFSKIAYPVVTTGTFDGVHLGHMTIINRLKEVAKKQGGETVLLTFFPHPRMVLQEDNDLKLINTLKEKIDLLEKAGIDHLIIHPFTKEFSRLTSLEFVRDLIVNKIGTKRLVIGYDHHFGRNREGSFDHLIEFGPLYGFEVEEIPAQDIDDVNVSSTKIRNALIEGDLKTANEYLTHPFSISGKVVSGAQNGRKLGYPTANIAVEENYKLIPAYGIYAVKIKHGSKRYRGMLNIGVRPTIAEADGKPTIEVNIFDFNGDLYGESISVQLIERIRAEEKFPTLEALKLQMEEDKLNSLNILNR